MNRRGFLQWLLAAVPAAAGAIYVPKVWVPVAKIQTHEAHVRAHRDLLNDLFKEVYGPDLQEFREFIEMDMRIHRGIMEHMAQHQLVTRGEP